MSEVAPCPSCHNTPDPNARFCKHCGAGLPQRCPSCGGENDPTARFCKHCGTSLDAQTKAPQATKPKSNPTPEPEAAETRRVRRKHRSGAPQGEPKTTSRPPGASMPGQPLLLVGGLVLVAAIVVVVAWQDGKSRDTPSTPSSGTGDSGFSGRVVLDPGLKSGAPASGTLYVTARVPGRAGGPPLAAVRLEASPNGTPFTIGPNDLMMEGLGGLNQPVVLSARWDQDGDASSVQPGDMLGELKEPVQPGSTNVVITLDSRAVKEDARAGGPVSPPDGAPGGPPAAAPPTGAPPPAAGQELSGTIVVAEALAGQTPSGGVFFVSARTQPGGAGPPLAAIRVKASANPTPFTIGPKDIMVGGAFDKPVYLTVRWDQDSDAFSKQPGDLTGTLTEPVNPGSNGVTLTLTERLP